MDKKLMIKYQKYNLKDDYEKLIGEGTILVKEVLSELNVSQDKYEDCFDIGMIEVIFFIKNFRPEYLKFIDMHLKREIKKQITEYLEEDSKIVAFGDLDTKEKIQIYENEISDIMAKIAIEEKLVDLKTFLDTLQPKDRELLEDYYSFNGKNKEKIKKVSKMHNLPIEDVENSVYKSLGKMKFYYFKKGIKVKV